MTSCGNYHPLCDVKQLFWPHSCVDILRPYSYQLKNKVFSEQLSTKMNIQITISEFPIFLCREIQYL